MFVVADFATVAAGAATGAAGRHAVQLWWAKRHAQSGLRPGTAPLAVLAINVVGSFVLGALTASTPATNVQLGLGTGMCGGFTTYSTFAMDTVRLLEAGKIGLAAAYAGASCAGSVAAAGTGYILIKRFKR